MNFVSTLTSIMRRQHLFAARHRFQLLAASLLLLIAPISQAIIIDSFDTDQLPVTLLASGDIGNTAGSSQAAAEALGGIRNYNATLDGGSFGNQIRAFVGGGLYNHVQDPSVTGRSRLIYDGSTDPFNVDATGLGGVDLTDGGTSNAIEVRVVFADQGGTKIIEVFTDSNNRSTALIPINVTTTEEIFIVPFTDFVTSAGATGPADFSNVGAVTLDVDGSTTAALDVQLDLLQSRATLAPEKSAALAVDNNGNGLVDAGDQIEYSVVVQNVSATPLNNVVFNDIVDINSTLDCTAPGDPTTTQGTITMCDTATGELAANIGVLDVGPSNAVTITFRVDVNTPIPDGVAEICNQGFFDGDTFTDIPTDDPATFDIPDDPTCLPVSSRIIIEKFTDPPGSPQVFEFTGDLNGGLFNLTDGNSFTEELAPGVYQVVESGLPGWNLTNLVCDDVGDPLTVVDLATRSATINLDGGETVTCTFTNTEEGSLTVIKQTNPPGATQVFDFTGSLGPFQLQDGQFITQSLPPSTYNVSETLPAGWALLSATCDNGSAVDNIIIGAGEDVTCTFVNGEEGSITIVKNTIGEDGTFEFTSSTLSPSPFNITTSGNTGSQTFSPLPPGVYDVAETVPTGWDLISATCSDNSPIGAIDLNGGENITCTFTNRQRGALIVEKIAEGGDDTFGFGSFTLPAPFDNFDIVTSGGSGSVSVPNLTPGTYDVAEIGTPAGWNLTGSSCSDGSLVTAIDIAAGETVTCTFTNQREGDITIVKNTVGTDATFDFTTGTLPGGNFNITTTGNTGSLSFTGLQPGVFDVAEVIPAGWQLTGLVCSDPNGNTVVDVAAGTASINLDPGESITCTFTNTQEGTLIVQKITDPSGSTQSFSFTGALGNFNLLDGQSNSGNLAPGVYSVAEIVPAGWQLVSAACSDGSPVSAIDLSAGETVICTFLNSVDASITIVKETIGNDGTFEFTSSTLSPSPFNITTSGNTGSQSFGPLPAGLYDVAETVPDGWDLISATCSDGSLIGAIDLNGGENITCTFTNRQRGALIVEKIAQGGDDTFGFGSFTLPAPFDNFDIVTSGGSGSVSVPNLTPGTYDVAEIGTPAGWNLTGSSCSDGSLVTAIDIAAGETVTCTFTNQREGDITIVKNTVGTDATFDFTTGTLPGGNFNITTTGNTGSLSFTGLQPGVFDVAEVIPAGWQLTGLVCSDPNGNTVVDVAAGTASINLDPGESITCTFTNTQEGSIIVEKQTNPDGATDLFSFSGDAAGAISDDQQIVVGGLLPGNYSSTEAVLADWTLSGIVCDDANSSGDVGTRTANFVLEAGETVTCVFTNVQGGSISVEKQTIPDGSAQSFTFSGDVAGNIADNGVITVPVGPGTYTSTEIVPAGWELTGIVCDDTDSTGDIATATATFQVDAGESVNCVFTNTQQGSIIVEKQTLPDGSAQTFGFSGDAAGTLSDGGEIIVNNLSPGVYSSTEAVPAGWDLTSIVCDDSDSSGDTGTATATFNLQAGETVRCVFTNTERGTIVVEKQTLPDGATDLFNFTGDAAGAISDGQQIVVNDLIPGNYSSIEAVPAGWDLTSVVCDDTNSSGDVATATASFVLDPGETVTCVFTNTQRGSIIVEKQTTPDGATDVFNFTGDAAGNISDDQQIVVNDLLPGNYSSTEAVPAGWALTSIVCDDANSSGNVGTATASFVLDPGETVTCVFNNTQGGSITVEKQTDPDGSAQTFAFTGDVAGTIGDDGSITVPVEPGTYTSTELLPAGWDLTSIVCDDSDSTGDIATATATFQVDAGEAVRCVFTNTGRGTIIVEKQTDPDGSTQTFDFSGDAIGSISDGQQIVVADLPPGVYTSTELVPAGWDLTSIACDADGSSGDVATATATFDLDAGQTITCVFNNTQRGSIVVEKQTLPDGAADVFNFTGDAAGNISDDQQIVVDDLIPGNYSSVESALTGWNLTGIVCDDANSSGDVATATANFVLDAGETVTCVFTNTQGGSITVEKQTDPDGSAQTFDFSGDVAGTISDNGSITVPVEPGTYTSTETVIAGWDLTAIVCDDDDSAGDIVSATATFEVAAGESVRCVFTNTGRGSIIVEKQTEPDGSTQTFAFSGDATGSISDGQQIIVNDLVPGTYSSVEAVPAGWDLTAIACDDGDSTGDLATATATFNLAAGETVTCVFTNTQLGSIIVEKQTTPDGATDVFNFSGDAAGNISDDQQIVVDGLVPGNYSSVESALTGWNLTGIACDDANSSGDVASATANFVLDAGETVTCVFTNTQGGSITVEKQTDPDGSAQTFDFSGDVAGTISDNGSITVPVEPGTYTSSELLPAGWDLTAIVCDDDDSAGDIASATATFEVAAGEAVRCVFTNTQRSTIVVVKETVGGDDSFDFTSTTLVPASFSLTTVAGSASTSFGDLTPGSYDVAETVPAGWTLTSQTCDNGDAPASISLAAGATVTCTFVNNIDQLEIVEVLSQCENDTAYVDYEVQNVPATLLGAGTTDFTIRWIAIEDGSNDVVEELVNPPLSGRLLWPGAEIDGDGNPIDWPGWDFVDGVGWVQVPTNLRPTILIEFEANNVVSEVLSYPPSTPLCSPNPQVSQAIEVPTLSRHALILMMALMLVMGLVATRNMRFARDDG